ncbi:MarR family winged helix-turn-helix transcriptional regulator [Actinoplanes regularis]|uniref:DNA-binding transcriptional regulator, MarR family n=1 Tax=Actinoplanes regularis TaxID=52697 RepID=A0A238WHV5_9ACTN|nr:MarR family winged helix-turn-helix transcriptional regulator [Actinoplanes regularis]GIE84867.1 MarR family transcriptional regulator [Actinoplanes regularis]GLW32488.1 MarR family transcriptional regulator [Actinoplanes regularis]SNR46120.1 DNA-binding transcriptional regulator, MarR family [Actinoplanes regularis]
MAAPQRTVLDVSRLLNEAGHTLTNRLAGALAEVDLTPRMQCVLVHALEEERTQIQLAALAGLDKTTMVSTVDELERRGLAERRASLTDRRARIIAVTETGRAVAEEGQRIVDRVHDEALAGFPEGSRAAFLTLLQALAAESVTGPVRRARGR